MPKKLTTKEFILKAQLVHGDKYDYSLVDYKCNKLKVIFICKSHGKFLQTPSNYLSGNGCPKCVGLNKTTEEFINEVKLIHGDKYDYSNVKYDKSDNKVIIVCKVHGEFTQIPTDHLSGRGCSKCVGLNKTTEEFINEAKLVHGDKFDYSEVKYNNSTDSIKIICKTHGEFLQTSSTHLSGRGCPKCAGMNKTTEEFVNQAKLIHGDKYDYSMVNYIRADKKMIIICKSHGLFEQTANNHLANHGCPRCVKLTRSAEEFTNKAKLVHGDKYDYSLVNYVKSNISVYIICNKHGKFKQTPKSHLFGYGCALCGKKLKTTENNKTKKQNQQTKNKHSKSQTNKHNNKHQT